MDNYPGADDELSMEDNNTSAFNCRDIPGTGRWSQHAFGRAIDLNPLLNPEIDQTGAIQPKTAAPYLDRNRTDPGILHAGDAAVRVFTDRGWRWGGYWRTPIDYQHLSDDHRHTTLETESCPCRTAPFERHRRRTLTGTSRAHGRSQQMTST